MALMTAPIVSFRRVQTVWGDTMQRLAARELGDAALWTTIAAMNDLAPPYLTGDPALAGPRVARYGDTLIVPGTAENVDAVALTAAEIFKQDVALPHGEFTVSNGNIDLIVGRENLKQAVGIRIRTSRGELLFHQRYGCDLAKLRGKGNNPIIALLGNKYVETALYDDDRVAKVTAVVVTPTGDRMEIEAEIRTVAAAPITTTVTV